MLGRTSDRRAPSRGLRMLVGQMLAAEHGVWLASRPRFPIPCMCARRTQVSTLWQHKQSNAQPQQSKTVLVSRFTCTLLLMGHGGPDSVVGKRLGGLWEDF